MIKHTSASFQKLIVVFCIVFSFFSYSACSKSHSGETLSSAELHPLENTASADPKEELLDSLLSSPSMVFTNTKGEADGIAQSILLNKKEFLKDLETVIVHDINDILVLADKSHYLEETYVPNDLIPLTANDEYRINRNDLSLRIPVEKVLRQMARAAKEEGISILVSSTYRSYEYQKNLYERNVKQLGKEAADRESAQPGTSQHQLGTAVDFGSITDEFALTKAGQWLDANAGNYGFSLSYPEGYERVTGYRWECWHYRYIGIEAVQFQKKWFKNIQHYMLEFLHHWKTAAS